ncbi:MAG: hypothetical protein Q8Q14_01825 [Gemmatimonadales bacterium]|nr:hypothetical protein [Gemmatimonadales bacterium]
MSRCRSRVRRPGLGRLVETTPVYGYYVTEYSNREQPFTVWRGSHTYFFTARYADALAWIANDRRIRRA